METSTSTCWLKCICSYCAFHFICIPNRGLGFLYRTPICLWLNGLQNWHYKWMPVIHVGWSWKDFNWSFPLLAHIIPYHFSPCLLKCSVGWTNRPHNIWQGKRSVSESARYIIQMAGLIQCNYMLLITTWTMPSLRWTNLAKLIVYREEFCVLIYSWNVNNDHENAVKILSIWLCFVLRI